MPGMGVAASATSTICTGFTIECDEPTAFQLDGEYVGHVDRVEFSYRPDAIEVLVAARVSTAPGVYHSPADGPRHRDQPGARPGGRSRPARGRPAGRRRHCGQPGLARVPLGFAGDAVIVAITWALVAVELLADSVWPGAQAGARLGRRIVAGGLVFELARRRRVPYVGLVVGAAVAAGVGLAMRRLRAGAVKAGGDVRGTALVEDGAGLATAAVAVIPFVGYLLAAAAGWLLVRLRRRDDQKFRGLRVLR